MIVRAKMPFVDKNTKKVVNTNTEFECTPERYKDIKKYVVVVKDDKAVKADK